MGHAIPTSNRDLFKINKKKGMRGKIKPQDSVIAGSPVTSASNMGFKVSEWQRTVQFALTLHLSSCTY